MLRRLGLGVLALAALGLVTASPAAAQDGTMSGTTSGMGMSGMAAASATSIHHPGDMSSVMLCTGCGALADPCSFGGNCQYLAAGMMPEGIGLHPTVNHANLSVYYPSGPLACTAGRGNQPARCMDAPAEWNLRSGMGPAMSPSLAPDAPGVGRDMMPGANR